MYAADTLEGLKTASPMSSGVTVTEKKSAVKTTLEVVPPGNPDSQFFHNGVKYITTNAEFALS